MEGASELRTGLMKLRCLGPRSRVSKSAGLGQGTGAQRGAEFAFLTCSHLMSIHLAHIPEGQLL